MNTHTTAPVVWGIIVTYCPEHQLLDALIHSVCTQLEGLVIVNNGTAADISNCNVSLVTHIVHLGTNKGIAFAANTGSSFAIEQGATHVIFFDQDSEAAPDMVEQLLEAEKALLDSGRHVGAVGPRYVDRRTGLSARVLAADTQACRKTMEPPQDGTLEVDMLITSGCMVPAHILKQVGGLREDLFIDHVDMEWCFRARSMGYGVFVAGSAVLMHAIGDTLVRFAGVKVIMHSPIRHYYMLRNGMALQRVNHMSATWRRNMRFTMLKQFVFYSLFFPKRRTRIPMMIQGLWDGLKGRMGPYEKRF